MAAVSPDCPNLGQPLVTESFGGYKRIKGGVPEKRRPALVRPHHFVPLVTQVWAIGHTEELKPLRGRNVRPVQVRKEQARSSDRPSPRQYQT